MVQRHYLLKYLPFLSNRLDIIHKETPELSLGGGGNVLFNDALNTLIYGYMASDI